MKRKLTVLINLIAISLLIFSVIYYGYYLYIGVYWGFTGRILVSLVSDGIFLLFIPVSIGLFLKKKWAWWLTLTTFVVLFMAKLAGIFANIYLLISGSIADMLGGSHLLLETLYLLLYGLIITLFSLNIMKESFGVIRPFTEWFWRVVLAAAIVYVLYFILTLILLSVLNPL
ncbi:hypothetical protein HXA34_10270 [Salipaludibacillus agaradhaerens]|uniref:hypothetical protein n=1 Tax=Salipaludibacillus agaradhaerens TaxID=76935 RepID=UPI00215128C8|nr:hypothetical protein [Salipaludibacillus agaradhaerens]MCR6106668.1 hypothetical protein [Salipaludibacillus agaradhaerens]MCR6118701.1 hypothetical protein [Salipaludibacillus agaradhaerens]UJW57782.1 hypothetical protein HXZ66_10395 [Bacillus sp. A116_S68]